MTHHVVVRGVNRAAIFRDDRDRRAFLARLASATARAGICCLAWSLLDNHVHVVAQTSISRLGTAMASLNTSYALYFNRRHGRTGHLFENRFRSRPILDDSDLVGVVLYVAANPLKHGAVPSESRLAQHTWSAYGALIGVAPPLPFHDARRALALFGDSIEAAHREVRRLVLLRTGAWPDLRDPDESKAKNPEELAQLVSNACMEFGVSPADLRTGRRTKPACAARAQVVNSAVQRGWMLKELAPVLGVSISGLSRSLLRSRGREGASQL